MLLRPGDQKGVVQPVGRPGLDQGALGPLVAIEHRPPARVMEAFARIIAILAHAGVEAAAEPLLERTEDGGEHRCLIAGRIDQRVFGSAAASARKPSRSAR